MRILSLTLVVVAACTSPPSPPPGMSASAELAAIADADQSDRKGPGMQTQPLDALRAIRERDLQRRRRTAELLDQLVTGDDFYRAALIFQHGDTPDDNLTAHELSLIAVMLGKFQNMPANAEDRFLVRIGRKQRFGGNFTWNADQKKLVISPVEEEGPTSVTDGLRADFLVPSLAEWKEHGGDALVLAGNRLKARFQERRDPTRVQEAGRRPVSAELRELASSGGPAAIERVLAVYRGDELATPDDYYHAALVVGPASWILAHELAVVAAIGGRREARRLTAETLDRFLLSIGRPQRYGTIPARPTGAVAPASVRRHLDL